MKYKLHPRCILLLSQILDVEDCRDSITDQVLHMVMKMEFGVRQGEHHTYDNIDEAFENLAGISRSEWIIALLEVHFLYLLIIIEKICDYIYYTHYYAVLSVLIALSKSLHYPQKIQVFYHLLLGRLIPWFFQNKFLWKTSKYD